MSRYIDLLQLIGGLINDPSVTPDNINEHIDILQLLTNNGKFHFNQELLSYLDGSRYLSPIKIKKVLHESDIVQETIYDFIQNTADLNKESFDELFNSISENMYVENDIGKIDQNSNHSYFWNESINNLIAYFIHAFRVKLEDGEYIYEISEELTIIDPATNKEWVVLTDLLPADAGSSFVFEEEWVIPWKNTNNISFKQALETHDNDVIKSVLTSDVKLQFTRLSLNESTTSEWLRLIMPQNNRRVEVTDLNRNFWVIGQVLSAICTYLFKEDNPISTMFKNLLNEVVQLWENIAFLWLVIESYLNTKNSGVKCWVIPIYGTQYQNFKKYDRENTPKKNGFEDLTAMYTESYLKTNFNYLIQKYKEYNFIVMPEIFIDNIFPNGYQSVYYPCLLTHYAGETTFQYNKIRCTPNSSLPLITFNSNRNSGPMCPKPYAARYTVVDMDTHKYSYGPSDSNNKTAFLRLKYNVSAEVRKNSYNEDDIILTSLYVEGIDGVIKLLQLSGTSIDSNHEKKLCYFGSQNMSTSLKRLNKGTINLTSHLTQLGISTEGKKSNVLGGQYLTECIMDNKY